MMYIVAIQTEDRVIHRAVEADTVNHNEDVVLFMKKNDEDQFDVVLAVNPFRFIYAKQYGLRERPQVRRRDFSKPSFRRGS